MSKKSFIEFNLSENINNALEKAQFSKPTDIQSAAIDHIINGKDLLASAPTGSGKTAAYSIPIIEKLQNSTRKPLKVLILVPTRELADQVFNNFKIIGKYSNIFALPIYGGSSLRFQTSKILGGIQILIACPGRLIDLMSQGIVKLDTIEHCVIDEMDKMIDMGFIGDIKHIISRTPANSQKIFFSATINDEAQKIAESFLKSPEIIKLSNNEVKKEIDHFLINTKEHLKFKIAVKLIKRKKYPKTIIFCNTQDQVQVLAKQLESASIDCRPLEGSMNQDDRRITIAQYRRGKFNIIISTNVMSRGIDISEVELVINYDFPENKETYIHRIGRTSRHERVGEAISIVTPNDRYFVSKIEETLGQHIKELHFDIESHVKKKVNKKSKNNKKSKKNNKL